MRQTQMINKKYVIKLKIQKGISGVLILIIVASLFVFGAYLFASGKIKGSKTQSSSYANIDSNIIVPPRKTADGLPASEALPSNVKEIRKKIIASWIANNNGDYLLYKTDSYKIEYIPTPDVFFVTIKKGSATKAKKDAQKWFLKFGLKQTDLCDLPVRFVLGNFEIRKKNKNFTSLPAGC